MSKFEVEKSDEEWRKILSAPQYEILRRRGTERAFTGPFLDDHEPGTFVCAGCEAELFTAEDKFESGCGWPSFSAQAAAGNVAERDDHSHGMERTEILCSRCGGHLGHVFPDGPRPTGLRYCVNGHALKKRPAK
jgi:peptide-methionine (R)-S-oxide reductase